MKKIIYLIVFLFCINTNTVFANTNIEQIEDLKSLDEYVASANINRIIKNDNVILKLSSTNFNEMFFVPAITFQTIIQYTDLYNIKITPHIANIFKEWNDYNYKNFGINLNENTIDNLLKKQIDLFYDELIIIDNGRRYNLLVEKKLSNKLKKEVKKNEKIIIKFLLLGYSKSNNENYILIIDYSINLNKNENNKNKTQFSYNDDYILAKKAIENEQFDFAISKLNSLRKKYPDNYAYNMDYCNALYIKNIKFKPNKSSKEILECYKALNLKKETAENYYILASIYFSDDSLINVIKSKLIIENSTKSLNLLLTEKNKNTMNKNEREIYYNNYHIRGIAKTLINDKTAQEDFDIYNSKYSE